GVIPGYGSVGVKGAAGGGGRMVDRKGGESSPRMAPALPPLAGCGPVAEVSGRRRSGLLEELDLDGELHVVGEDEAAGIEGGVPDHAELLAVDLAGEADADAG